MRVVRLLAEPAHQSTPLVVRASLPRTFLGLGIFAEVGLVFVGIYLLMEEMKRPLEADPSSVIGAGVLLALATILFFYLVSAKRFEQLSKEDDVGGEDKPPESPLTAYGESLQARLRAERILEEEEETLPGPM
jgi:hypothetical protein